MSAFWLSVFGGSGGASSYYFNANSEPLAAVFLASQDASWVTGVALSVDGGYVAL